MCVFFIKHHLASLPSGYSCSLRSQRRSFPPEGGGAAQDRRRAGLQCDGRQGAKLPYLHLSHYPRRRGWEARWPKARGSAPVCQWCGKSNQIYILIQRLGREAWNVDWRESVDKLFFFIITACFQNIYLIEIFLQLLTIWSSVWYVVWRVSQQSGELLRSKCCICLK